MLSLSDARYYMTKALNRRFGNQYKYRVAGKTSCKRSSYTRARCSIRWGIGDSGYSGYGYIWYSEEDGETWWNYSWRIKRTNFYCLDVLKKPLSKCRTNYVVR